jgi:rare lipoprotein A
LRVFRFRYPLVVAPLAAVAAAVLLGSQQLLSKPAPAAPVSDGSMRLAALTPTEQPPALMAAALPSGDFEEPVKTTPVPTAAPAVEPTPEPAPELEAASMDTPKPLWFESGIASTYGQGDGFEGKRTACGQIFHTHEVQVAHKSLPCGTIVRVESVETGKTVDAEVTDRGPYVAGRVVDLSHAAFSELDPSGYGLLHVNVYILDTSNQYGYQRR